MSEYPATVLCDFYKISHRPAYPDGTQQVYATWIPRASRIPSIDRVVFFGLQAFVKRYLIDYFNQNFFRRPIKEIVGEYSRIIHNTLGIEHPEVDHLVELHKLGYLPLLIKAVPEGTRVPLRTPMFTIENTRPEAFWLTNYIESLLSAEIWHPCTSATLAYEFRKLFDDWAEATGGPADFVPFQGHDFSMRGMPALESAAASGAGHLLSFVGTDTIPSIVYAEKFYGANIEKELVGTSVPATEHSVACAYGSACEQDYFRRIITEVYPKGIVSVVSDTWDLWHVLQDILPSLSREIMTRDGKLVIRPDSGRPADIICGDPKAAPDSPASYGVIECLNRTFGGTTNEKGFKRLDPHVGAIYGDAITYDVAREICERLAEKGFESTNMVYGIGSFTYQYVTRDTFSFALKSTHAVINNEEVKIFKDPVTDPGSVKKSLVGRVVVRADDQGNLVTQDNLTIAEQAELAGQDLLQPVFQNGVLTRYQKFSEIRDILHPSTS